MLLLPNVPSTEESVRYTSPIKLFEYMASGRPIVAADLSSIREVLSIEVAVLFKAGDMDALSAGIKRILSSPHEAEEMSGRARGKVYAFSWEARAQLLLNIVRSHARNRMNIHTQFIKSAASSLFTAVLYFSLMYIFTEYFKFWHIYSILIASMCALATNFALLKFVFVGGKRTVAHEFLIYLLLVLANLFINGIVAYILVEKLNVWYMLAQFLIIGALAIANFFVYRSSVFQTTRQ